VRAAHPDTGGDVAAFMKLQEAFEQAMDYVCRHTPRWTWLADMVETYSKQQRLIEKLQQCGATVEMEQANWLAPSWGEDFAQVAQRIVGIHLHGPAITDDVIDLLLQEPLLLANLRWLDLARTGISDRGLQRLGVLTSLRNLNLRDTHVTAQGLQVVARLPELRVLDLRGTEVCWTARVKLRWSFPGLKVVSFRTRQRMAPSLGQTIPKVSV
jgi:hypothetical protein